MQLVIWQGLQECGSRTKLKCIDSTEPCILPKKMKKGYRLIGEVNCRAESFEHEANLWLNQASEVDGVRMTQGQTAHLQSYRVFF